MQYFVESQGTKFLKNLLQKWHTNNTLTSIVCHQLLYEVLIVNMTTEMFHKVLANDL